LRSKGRREQKEEGAEKSINPCKMQPTRHPAPCGSFRCTPSSPINTPPAPSLSFNRFHSAYPSATGITCVTPSPESTTVPVRLRSFTSLEVHDAASASTACGVRKENIAFEWVRTRRWIRRQCRPQDRDVVRGRGLFKFEDRVAGGVLQKCGP